MFANVLVAVDGSEVSRPSLEWAVEMARLAASPLIGLYVMDGQWADFIGNDWQSSRNSRQGFLDYVQEAQEKQLEAARQQFFALGKELPHHDFRVLCGDPVPLLVGVAKDAETAILVVSRRVFQVCGRPSLKSLAGKLAGQATRPLLLLP